MKRRNCPRISPPGGFRAGDFVFFLYSTTNGGKEDGVSLGREREREGGGGVRTTRSTTREIFFFVFFFCFLLPFLLAEGLAINYTSSANPSIWYKGSREGKKKQTNDVGNKPWEGRPRSRT